MPGILDEIALLNEGGKNLGQPDLPASPSSPAGGRFWVLPNDNCLIVDSARQIFQDIAQTGTMFVRGSTVVEPVESENGSTELRPIGPDDFRSRLERYDRSLVARIRTEDGGLAMKPKRCSADSAKALLASVEARTLLPRVDRVVSAPVLTVTPGGEMTVLTKGLHPHLATYVTGGGPPSELSVDDAVQVLNGVVEQFDFVTPGDRARALAAFITPALVLGGFMKSQAPIDIAEADQSQAGKGYRHKLVRAVFLERAYLTAKRTGGVGSMDESLSCAVFSGKPFIALDNLRGAMDSPFLDLMEA